MRLPPCQSLQPRRTPAAPPCPGLDAWGQRVGNTVRGLVLIGAGAVAMLVSSSPAPPANAPLSASAPSHTALAPARLIDWGTTAVSAAVKHTAQWSASTQDHADMPFVIVDKPAAHLYVFDTQARLVAHTPVLLGSAVGDHTVPGIGEKAIADVLPEERTTPAGRFLGRMGENLSGENVVWVDYDAAVSMHRVRANRASEQRLERLASETADDNRISYGCINVPVAFFETHLLPLFANRAAPIYVLPERESLTQVFGMTR